MKKLQWKGALKKLLFVSLAIAAVLAAMHGCRSSFIFYPDRSLAASPAQIGLSYEDVRFNAGTVLLHGWWVPVEKSRGTVLFCHGNAGNISHRLSSIRILNRLKLNVFIFDYRGYGGSEGRPSVKGTYADVEAAWNYLVRKRGVSAKSIVLFGRSLGGAVAAWCAARHRPGALVLESTFSSAADLANYHYPFLPGSLVMGDAYESSRQMKSISCPVLVIHSPDDEIIPFSHGRKLFSLARGPREFLRIQGGHNGGFMESMDIYFPALENFISKHLN